jgi:beta-phosphoglucomutase-like phosphatase (HAD superfamily)
VTALYVSDAAFADADAVFAAAVTHLAAKYAAIRPLAAADVPADRAAAMPALDAWAGDASWRTEVVRFYEASAPVLLRPDPELNALLRSARRAGRELTVVSPLPRAAVELYLAQLGVRRMAVGVLGEEDAPPPVTVRTRAELVAALS